MGLLRYLYNALRYPGAHRLGFLAMGLGIEARAKRLKPYWASHTENTLRCQSVWCSEPAAEGRSADGLLILGAGRLFDVNASAAASAFGTLTLFDADPLCIPVWRTLQASYPKHRFKFVIAEVSSVLSGWISRLETTRPRNWRDALRLVAELPSEEEMPPSALLSLESPRAVLSLNILSQIPLLWQDNVERWLSKHFPAAWIKGRDEEWLASVSHGALRLVDQHLRDLPLAGADDILLITDLEYCRYTLSGEAPGVSPPLVYQTGAPEPWKAAPGIIELKSEVWSALYGRSSEDVERIIHASYKGGLTESWLWHIEPQGDVQADRGTVHRVGAFSFSRRSN